MDRHEGVVNFLLQIMSREQSRPKWQNIPFTCSQLLKQNKHFTPQKARIYSMTQLQNNTFTSRITHHNSSLSYFIETFWKKGHIYQAWVQDTEHSHKQTETDIVDMPKTISQVIRVIALCNCGTTHLVKVEPGSWCPMSTSFKIYLYVEFFFLPKFFFLPHEADVSALFTLFSGHPILYFSNLWVVWC